MARVFLAALGVIGSVASALGGDYQGPGTKRMAERLESLALATKPLSHPFLNAERAELIRQEMGRVLAGPESPEKAPKLIELQSRYAVELLNAGKTTDAIVEFTTLENFMKMGGVNFSEQSRGAVRQSLALCYLRLGEQENCLTNHTIDSCLLPIGANGVHRLQRGSRTAISILTKQLDEFPNDLKARWLINVAYMTVGEYPAQVPANWLIPPKTFESDYPMPRFFDVAGKLDLDLNDLAGGVIMDDFDGDGNLDLMISAWGLHDQLRYFHNNADGTFTERTVEAGLIGEVGGLNLLQADYNNDGNLDVLVMRGAWLGTEGHYPKSLLRNNGDGTFEDVTEVAGLLGANSPSQAAVWFDYNNDGYVDLFIGNESTPGDTNRCQLYRNNGDGTFTEVGASVGLDVIGFVKAVTAADYNHDGWPDLYLSCRSGGNLLFRNDGPQGPDRSPEGAWKFTNVTREAGVAEPEHSFTSWFFDYDNDGWPDIFVAGYFIKNVGDVAADYLGLPHNGERSRLYHNNHDGTFTDVTKQMGLYKVLLAMSGNFGDLDNDGYLDFYLGTGDPDLSTLIPKRMFRNAEGKGFQDVTTAGGFGHLQKGHAIAFGDLDNDGDQDVYISIGGAYQSDFYRNALFENPGNTNHWLKLKLVGVTSNRAAIGASIKVTVEPGARTIYKSVNSGGSFGANPLRQEIGLGSAEAITEVEVNWPASKTIQKFTNLSVDNCYTIREGDPVPTLMKLKTFKLLGDPNVDHSHHHPTP